MGVTHAMNARIVPNLPRALAAMAFALWLSLASSSAGGQTAGGHVHVDVCDSHPGSPACIASQVAKNQDGAAKAAAAGQVQQPPATTPPTEVPVIRIVPGVVGLPEQDAIVRIREAGFAPEGQAREDSPQQPDTVTRTEPPAESRAPAGSTVGYWLASGNTKVPRLRKQLLQEARSRLSGAGLAEGAIEERAADVPPGIILEQNPGPGTSVPLGLPVAMVVSIEFVTVPNVIDSPIDVAMNTLAHARLRGQAASKEGDPSPKARGIVLDTDPRPVTRVPPGTEVKYRYASGQNHVPDVLRQSRESARQELGSEGFQLGNVRDQIDLGPPGIVLRQTPEAGSIANLHTPVDVAISTELFVPNVVTRQENDAISTLRQAGLVPRAREAEPSLSAKGTVLGTDPEAGEKVLGNTDVHYWTASGEYQVPDLSGESTDAASQKLKANRFELGEIKTELVPNGDGRIHAQVPAAGASAELGSRIAVTIRAPSPPIPNVVGMTAADADRELQDKGFSPRRAPSEPSDAAKGIVLRTDPEAGATEPPGAPVIYWPASGENIVPDTHTLPPAEASQRILAAGFVVGATDYVYVPGITEQVQEQSLQAGALAPLRSEISLKIASSVPIVPNLIDKSMDEAEALLKQAGLAVGTTTREYRFGEADVVFNQEPAPGTRPAPGPTVALWVSSSFAIAGIGVGVLLLGLAGTWWTQLRPWPLKLPLHVNAKLEPMDVVDEESIFAVRSMGVNYNVVVSAHLEAGTTAQDRSIPAVRAGVEHD